MVTAKRRVCVIGLDCLSPELVFGELRDAVPYLTELAAQGLAGRIESTIPPITIPAWSVMLTGVDPGVLGCYGFRNRSDRGYENRRLSSSVDVQAPTLWTYLKAAGARSRLISVPQTYPPKPMLGMMVSDYPRTCGLAPITYPTDIAGDVRRIAEGELTDVADHRHMRLDDLREAIHAATRRRFRLARAWAKERDWTLLMVVEMGPDRMHHAFWQHHHGLAADPEGLFTSAIRDYYIHLDREVGRLIATLSADDIVLVISDHGAQTNKGGIALNQWLLDRGYLHVHNRPAVPTSWDALGVDWARTRVWADGGHVGRLYFNIIGREPCGTVRADEAAALARELGDALRALPGPHGQSLATSVYQPCEIYQQINGIAPDLIVYFDDLAYRAIGSVGYPNLYPPDNDTGRDAANHARHGVIILRDGRGPREAPGDASLYDVVPTVLERLGLAIPPGLRGQPLG